MIVAASLFRHLLALLSLIPLGVAATDKAGTAYLKEKSKLADVVTLPSGLRYKVLEKGKGIFHPKESTPCLINYAGTLIDGTEFESSYTHGSPKTFSPNHVVKGWSEAMQLMVEGDKWELYTPSDLAYGEYGLTSEPKVPRHSAVVYIIEMIEIMGEKVIALTCNTETLKDCNEKMKAYIENAKTKFGRDKDTYSDEISKEIKRLMKVTKGGGMKDESKAWFDTRIFLLQQILLNSNAKEEL